MKIGPHEIGLEPFIIGEVSLNHGGDVARAVQMIEVAKEAGCTACKFQTYRVAEFCKPDDPMYETFKQCELPDEAWPILADQCRNQGIIFLSTPQNPSDLAKLLPLGMPAIKVGSDDFCNGPLLYSYASHGLPMLLSTGMSDIDQIRMAETRIGGQEHILMVCTSQYPAPLDEVNILRVRTLRKRYDVVGFSDHTVGNTASIMAVALGACVFEKHFTLDHNLPGPEHSWACNPDELASWVSAIKEAWSMKGTGSFELSEREREQKRRYQRRPGVLIRGEA